MSVRNFMNPQLPLSAPTYNELIEHAKQEKAAGIIRKGCGKIISAMYDYNYVYEVCACGGTLPPGEKRAEDRKPIQN